MLFITGLLTLLAIAQAGGDHIKGGVKGGSVAQHKVSQDDIIPSPLTVKSAVAPFGSKVMQPEASDPLSKIARGAALHHTVKTAAATPGKTHLISGLHHAASSPVIQDQVTIEDPASGSIKSVKTIKSAGTGKTRFSQQDIPGRDPISRPVVQTIKTVQDPVSGTKQIKTVKMIDPMPTRFSQDDKQLRDTPIARSVIQTVKSSEDPSASVVTKTVKTTVKTAEPSNLRLKTNLKTAQQSVDLKRVSNAPLSFVEATRRNTLTSPVINAAALSSERGISSSIGGQGLLFNSLGDSSGTELVNELGEMILDEKTLQTLQNAGGITNENGRIALNDEGIKILQSIRGRNSMTSTSGTSATRTSNIRGGALTRTSSTASTNSLVNIRSSSTPTTGSAALSPGNTETFRRMQSVAMRSQGRSPQRSQSGNVRTRVTDSASTSSFDSSRTLSLSSQSTPNVGAGVLSSNVLSEQSDQGVSGTSGGSIISGTALFNGKEIAIDGLKEGQIFDENLRPVLSNTGRIEIPENVATITRIRAPQSAQAGVLRTSAISGVTRNTIESPNPYTVSGVVADTGVRRESSRASITTSRRYSQVTGLTRTSGSLPSGTALFDGKEVNIDGLKEGQLFDENLRPLTAGASFSSSGQISNIPSGSAAAIPSARAPQRSQLAGSRSSAVSSTSRGTVSSSRTSSSISQSTPNVRAGPLTTISSGQRVTQSIGGVRTGGSLTTGTALFNGKEVSVEGLKEGQLFDENLRPITSGVSISSTGQVSGVPSRSAVSRPRAGVPQRSQSAGLRSSVVSSTSSGITGSSRTSSLMSQYTPNVRAGPLTTISSGQRVTQTVGGVRSGGSLATGTALFNGKEVSVEGLKEGQLFDENLRPITSGASISSTGQVGGVPSRSAPSRPRAGIPQRSQSAGLRSSTVSSTSRGTISRSRTSSSLPQSAPNVRAGSLTTTSSGQRVTQSIGGVRTGGSLTTGTALFNGKEVSVEGLKEGQLFDENLRPITSGVSISSTGQVSGVPSRSAVSRPRAGVPQRSQSAGLRSSVVSSTSSGITGSSRTSSLTSQYTPNVRAGPLTTISSGQRVTQTVEGVRSGGSLATGTALFNGKEVSVEGLKEGQFFDENLRPITSGVSISSTGQVSGVPSRSAASRPRAGIPQRSQSAGLRSSTVSSTSRGTVSRSRTRSSLPQSTPNVRAGSLTTISSGQRRIQTVEGVRSVGPLTTGTALFNGKEVNVEGLKEGQLFDENLKPLTPGSSVSTTRQISGVSSRISATGPNVKAPQRSQSAGVRSSSMSSTSKSSASRYRTSTTVLTKPKPVVNAAPFSSIISSAQEDSQKMAGISSGGSLMSGKVLFNGKEVNVDGLKEGQLFDENLQPVLPGIQGVERSGIITSSGDISGASFGNIAQSPEAKLKQAGRLRSTSTSRTVGRVSNLSSQRTSTGGVGPINNVISYEAGISQSGGAIRSGGSLASGMALFNGKEIRIDGMKEGQMFDENLQPILPGSAGIISETSSGVLSSGQISTIPSRVPTADLKPKSGSPLRLQTGGLRSSAVSTSSSSGSNSRSGTLLNQFNPILRSGPLTNTISSEMGRSSTLEAVRPISSLNSGMVLFNGKEISIDGVKEGQMFDENLQPILPGSSGINAQRPAGISSAQLSRVSSTVSVPKPPLKNISKPKVRSQQRTVTSGIGQAVSRGSSTGAFTSSRISGSSGTQQTAGIRTGSLTSSISSTTRSSQALVGARSQTSGISGTALFNGKEVAIDGLREGQMFDENLKPITSGTSRELPGRMTLVQNQGQISSTLSGGAVPKPRIRSQVGGSRSSFITSSVGGSVSSSRTLNSAPNLRRGTIDTSVSSAQRTSQTIGGGRSGSVLFDGKEINVEGIKPGQLYDENLQPITSGISGIAEKSLNIPGSTQRTSITSQNLAPKPRMRTPQRSQAGGIRPSVSSSSTGTVSSSRTLSRESISTTNVRSGALPARSSQAVTGIRSGGTLTSGTALFDGKEVKIDGLKEGQLFDENLRPIMSGTSGTLLGNSASRSSSGQISGILPANIESKPVSRPSQQFQSNRLRSSGITSSRSASAVQSLSNARAGPLSSGVSSTQGLSQTFQGVRSSGSLASGTALFNGKEISIDGLKEGQIFDENLRPIVSDGGYSRSIQNSDTSGNVQMLSTRNLRTGTSSVTSSLRSQANIRGSPAVSGSLNYIDVTRTDESPSRSSSENILGGLRVSSIQRNAEGGVSAYANTFGSKVTQDRVTPEISQYGVDAPIQESIMNLPDDPFKKASSMKAPSISRQTQLKVEDVLEQSSLVKPEAFRSVQETVPFSIPDSSKTVSKKTLTNIAQISQKNIDIPTAQQKLLEDFSGYLPKTSFLPPFNYALPQISASKYSSPMSQVQQKMEQVFV